MRPPTVFVACQATVDGSTCLGSPFRHGRKRGIGLKVTQQGIDTATTEGRAAKSTASTT